jgi:hypothetical protein
MTKGLVLSPIEPRHKNMGDPDRETARRLEAASRLFFSTGTQYYVSGRYAVTAGLSPVAGNLLHHAVEMSLKGGLARSMELKELKDLGTGTMNRFRPPTPARCVEGRRSRPTRVARLNICYPES